MKEYLYIVRINVMNNLVYRFDVFVTIIINLISLVLLTFIWHSAYAGKETVEGVTLEQMVTYTVISVTISTILRSEVEYSISDLSVREPHIEDIVDEMYHRE